MSGRKKKKNWFTIVNVMVTARANIVKYDYFYYIFQTAGPLATKLGFDSTAL